MLFKSSLSFYLPCVWLCALICRFCMCTQHVPRYSDSFPGAGFGFFHYNARFSALIQGFKHVIWNQMLNFKYFMAHSLSRTCGLTCKNVSVAFTVFLGYHPSVLSRQLCCIWWNMSRKFVPTLVVLSSYASSVKTGGPSLWRVLPDGVCLAFDTEHWFASCAEPSAFPSSSPLCMMHLDNNTLTSRRVLCVSLSTLRSSAELYM